MSKRKAGSVVPDDVVAAVTRREARERRDAPDSALPPLEVYGGGSVWVAVPASDEGAVAARGAGGEKVGGYVLFEATPP
ncbi:MAG: hypothetical protein ACO3UW_08485 [Candidatus Nanopelagicales bacterium]